MGKCTHYSQRLDCREDVCETCARTSEIIWSRWIQVISQHGSVTGGITFLLGLIASSIGKQCLCQRLIVVYHFIRAWIAVRTHSWNKLNVWLEDIIKPKKRFFSFYLAGYTQQNYTTILGLMRRIKTFFCYEDLPKCESKWTASVLEGNVFTRLQMCLSRADKPWNTNKLPFCHVKTQSLKHF